ncbi:MAG: hypothetical protein II725_05910 [Firmicutes bacterium]|nr:hypothetical protein [Bacillota bacterium]
MMTLEEAKEFYFQYLGSFFHMDREEPAKAGSFRMLGLGKDILRAWDEELLEGIFSSFRSDPERVWVRHGDVLRIAGRNNCDTDKYLGMLLREMEDMDDLDLFNITLIIENMAGRNEALNDGGAYLFCKYTALAGKMNDITEHLIEVCRKKYGADERSERAVRRYRKAFRKWTGSGK